MSPCCCCYTHTPIQVEYGLTDIQEYYANTGALVAAAKNAREGKDVGCR